MEKLKKFIDEAFKQSLSQIGSHYGVDLDHLNIIIRFVGSKVEMIACEEKRTLGQFATQFLIGSKLVGLRYDAQKIIGVFRALQFTFSSYETLKEADDVSLILYNSKKAKKPCISILVNNKPQKTLSISNVIEALEIGIEQYN